MVVWEFIVISLFYTTTNRHEKKLVVAILTGTRSITETRALFQVAFYFIHLQGIITTYSRDHLRIVEIAQTSVRSKDRLMLNHLFL